MASENETVEDIVHEARDKYTVHKCNECNWRKSCMGRKFGDSECVNNRVSIDLAFGIEDGYFSGLLDRIEAAHRRYIEHRAIIAGVSLADAVDEEHKREVAELRECLKEAVESYCEWCNDFVGGKQKCEPCECKARKWRKALEGGES